MTDLVPQSVQHDRVEGDDERKGKRVAQDKEARLIKKIQHTIQIFSGRLRIGSWHHKMHLIYLEKYKRDPTNVTSPMFGGHLK